MFVEEREIGAVVGVVEKGVLPAVAALGHVMRGAGDDDACKTSHVRSCMAAGGRQLSMTSPYLPVAVVGVTLPALWYHAGIMIMGQKEMMRSW